MTQEDIAKALYRNKQTIVNWENGVTEIKVTTSSFFFELYEIPIEFLAAPERKSESRKATQHQSEMAGAFLM